MIKHIATLAALLILTLSLAGTAAADEFGSGANSFEIEFVTIGNPGNPFDMIFNPNPPGSVDYSFRMGKFEISRDMVTKANIIGNLGITLLDSRTFAIENGMVELLQKKNASKLTFQFCFSRNPTASFCR